MGIHAQRGLTSRTILVSFLVLIAVWTIAAASFVVVDQGWTAICVAGIGSVVVNGSAAFIGVVYAIVYSIREGHFRWWELIAAIIAPAASAGVIFGMFLLALRGWF
jgi:hypothetical protein